MRILIPIPISIAPPNTSARLRKRRPKRLPIHMPVTENTAVEINITAVATTILTTRNENEIPTAAASILVAIDNHMSVRVCQG